MAHTQRFKDLEERLRPIVAHCGLELDTVTCVNESGMTILRVIIDTATPGEAVDSEQLALVTRAVSPIIDEVDPIDSEYFLEVSSPGAERELVEPRHWVRQVGYLARVKLRDGTRLTGTVLHADREGAEIEVEGQATRIEYAQMKKARARVEFGSEE